MIMSIQWNKWSILSNKPFKIVSGVVLNISVEGVDWDLHSSLDERTKNCCKTFWVLSKFWYRKYCSQNSTSLDMNTSFFFASSLICNLFVGRHILWKHKVEPWHHFWIYPSLKWKQNKSIQRTWVWSNLAYSHTWVHREIYVV